MAGLPTPLSKAGGAPVYSPTWQPGFQPNIGGSFAAPPTHSDWVQAMVEYYASLWSHGQRDQMPAGLNVAQLGQQDTGGQASAPTLLQLTQYFQNYQPHEDPAIDANYIPPGPNDYVQDPTVTAAQIANDQWQKYFDESVRQFGITADQTARTQAVDAFNKAFQNQLTQYASSIGLYNDQVRAQLDAYNTQADLFKSGQQLQEQGVSQAGNLAAQLQGILDKRTQNAIDLQANPNDFVAREYAVRALKPPTGTNVPAYSNQGTDALSQVIARLINYTPPAGPQAPSSVTSAQPQVPTAPNQQTFQMPAGVQMDTNIGKGPAPSTFGSTVASTPTSSGFGTTHYYNPATGTYQTNPVGTTPQAPPIAQNYVGGATPTTGDIATAWPGSTMKNGVLYDAQGHYSTDMGNTWTQNNQLPASTAGSVPKMAMGSIGTAARQMVVGDPQSDGLPNPEMVMIHNPGPMTTTEVVPMKGKSKLAKKAKKLAKGTPRYADGTAPSDPTLKSYDDSAYQNFPSLSYLQGNTSAADYNTLATGTTPGAFGTAIPESGSLNYRRYLDVARDPVSLANVASLYNSANRNLAADVARAKARAPFGQAISTALVKT